MAAPLIYPNQTATTATADQLPQVTEPLTVA